MTLLVALSTASYFLLRTRKTERIRFDLLHTPFVRHVVGRRPTHDLILTENRAELMRDVSSSLGNGMYFVVGRIVSVVRHGGSVSGGVTDKPTYYDVVLDAGMLLNTSQSGYSPAPHVRISDLQVGQWIAGIGFLHLRLDGDEEIGSHAGKLLQVFHTDLNPSSQRFGDLIPTDYLHEKLPYDPDVFNTPYIFAQIEVD